MLPFRAGPGAASVLGVNDSTGHRADTPSADSARPAGAADLDRIERELAGVEIALARLDAGTYWTDEVTGDPIPDEVLAADPVARRRS